MHSSKTLAIDKLVRAKQWVVHPLSIAKPRQRGKGDPQWGYGNPDVLSSRRDPCSWKKFLTKSSNQSSSLGVYNPCGQLAAQLLWKQGVCSGRGKKCSRMGHNVHNLQTFGNSVASLRLKPASATKNMNDERKRIYLGTTWCLMGRASLRFLGVISSHKILT